MDPMDIEDVKKCKSCNIIDVGVNMCEIYRDTIIKLKKQIYNLDFEILLLKSSVNMLSNDLKKKKKI